MLEVNGLAQSLRHTVRTHLLMPCFMIWCFGFTNGQSPDALASGLWNGEFGGDLLSHG